MGGNELLGWQGHLHHRILPIPSQRWKLQKWHSVRGQNQWIQHSVQVAEWLGVGAQQQCRDRHGVRRFLLPTLQQWNFVKSANYLQPESRSIGNRLWIEFLEDQEQLGQILG